MNRENLLNIDDVTMKNEMEFYIRFQNNVFWLYEYSKRHFFEESEHAYSLQSLVDHYRFKIIPKLFEISSAFKKELLPHVGNADETDLIIQKTMGNLLAYYHNLKQHKDEEKFIYISNYITDNDYEYCLNSLDTMDKQVLKKIHTISYDYGFYAWYFLAEFNMDDILSKCVREGDNCRLFKIPLFLKKDDVNCTDLEKMKISYIESFHDEAYFRNDSNYQLSIYIDPENEFISMKKIKAKVSDVIEVRTRQLPYSGTMFRAENRP